MSNGDPVEFTRRTDRGLHRVGNEVQLTDGDGNPISSANPLPTSAELAPGSEVTLAPGSEVALAAGTETVGATMDAGPAQVTLFGLAGVRFTSANQSASAASVTDAPVVGQKLVITDIIVSVEVAMRVDFKEETSGTILLSLYLPANGSGQITPRSKLKLATINKKLQVQTSVAGNIAVTAFYYSEA